MAAREPSADTGYPKNYYDLCHRHCFFALRHVNVMQMAASTPPLSSHLSLLPFTK